MVNIKRKDLPFTIEKFTILHYNLNHPEYIT